MRMGYGRSSLIEKEANSEVSVGRGEEQDYQAQELDN